METKQFGILNGLGTSAAKMGMLSQTETGEGKMESIATDKGSSTMETKQFGILNELGTSAGRIGA
jgi:germacradienol/geosmin synthase